MSGINLSRSPYFDDFNANDNYYQVLFRPSVAVQTRELNQVQSILQDQITKFGRNIFKDGSITEGCSFSFDKHYTFVKIDDNYSNGTAFIIADFQDMWVTNINGLKGVIVNTFPGYQTQDPDTNTLYIKYLNSTTYSNGVQQSVFAPSEDLQVTTPDGIYIGNVSVFTPNTLDPNSISTGYGYSFTSTPGVVYKNGYFINVHQQTVIISKYNNYPDGISVGFVAVENIVTPESNTSIYDNALGSPNYSAPGAHRYQLIPELVTMQTNNITNSTSFFSLCDFQSGAPISIRSDPQYSIIGAEMARRGYETNGDYVVSPFLLTTETKSSFDPNSVLYNNLVAMRGLGYVKGYRNQYLNNVTVPIKKAVDYALAESTVVTATFGNYVLINEYAGDFDTTKLATVELHNVAISAVSNTAFLGSPHSTSTIIGYANLRGLSYYSGNIGTGNTTYAAYLFNIQMNAGHSFSEVRNLAIYGSVSYKATADVIPLLSQTISTVVTNTVMVPLSTTVSDIIVGSRLQHIPPLPAPIVMAEGALLGNGNILTFGGIYSDFSTGSNLCFTYDPTNNTWGILPAFPQRLGLGGATELSNGSVVAGGGWYSWHAVGSGNPSNPSSAFYRYDPGANTWTQIASLPIPVVNYGLATIGNGSVLSVGGWTGANSLGGTANCYRYDPGANTWTQVASLPQIIGGQGCAALSNGSVLSVCGVAGNIGTGAQINSCYRYDPGANTWTQVADHPIIMNNLVAARITNGNIISIGGRTSAAGNPPISNCYAYDPTGNTWSQIASLPIPLGENGCAPLSNGSVMTITGMYAETTNTFTQNCYLYDPGQDIWKTTISIPTFTTVSNVITTMTPISNTTTVNTIINSVGIIQSNYNKMIFPIGQKALKLDGFNNQSYVYRKEVTSTFLTNGHMTVSMSSSLGSAVESFDFGGYLSPSAESQFIVIPSGMGTTTNKTGTVSIPSDTSNVTGVGTTFLVDYAPGDFISINSQIRQINVISTNGLLTLTQPLSSPGAIANVHHKVFPSGVPIDFSRSGRSISITSSAATFVLGEALSGSFNVGVYFDVLRAKATSISKVLKPSVYVAINCASHPNGATGPWSLGLADIININAVYIQEDTFSNSVYNSSASFALDNGQRDDHYELGTLYSLSPTLSSTSRILVDVSVFAYDMSQGVGFFNANSYPVDDANTDNTTAIRTELIPQYTTTDGTLYDLRDCIDFRPFANNVASTSANSLNWSTTATINPNPYSNLTFYVNPSYGSFLPSPDTNYIGDIQYYLPRVDKAALSTSGQLLIVPGTPSLTPIPSIDLPNAMTLGIVYIPPYPSLSTQAAKRSGRYDYAMTVSVTQNKRYTMSDINSIDNRVNKLEYYTSLSLLEQQAKTILVRSSATGQNRFQNGIMADPFDGHDIADTTDDTYNICIDSANGELRPALSTFVKSLWTDVGELPFNTDDYIFQNYTTCSINCCSNYTFRGRIDFKPTLASIIDTNANPDIVNNLAKNSNYTNISASPDPGPSDYRSPYGMDWGYWQHYAPTALVNHGATYTANYVGQSYGTTTSGVVTVSNWSYFTTPSGAITDPNVVDYSQCRTLSFVAKGLKPNTVLYAFCGQYNMSYNVRQCVAGFADETLYPYGYPITSDSYGYVYGKFTVPYAIFKQGIMIMTLCDVPDIFADVNNITTRADGCFVTQYAEWQTQASVDLDYADLAAQLDIHFTPSQAISYLFGSGGPGGVGAATAQNQVIDPLYWQPNIETLTADQERVKLWVAYSVLAGIEPWFIRMGPGGTFQSFDATINEWVPAYGTGPGWTSVTQIEQIPTQQGFFWDA